MAFIEIHKKTTPQSHLVGSYRRFGEVGPAYEILGLEGDVKLMIRVLESGEKLVYPLAKALADPVA